MSTKKSTKKSEQETAHETLLAIVQDLQAQFWDSLAQLETETGLEIDGTAELSGYSLKDLYRRFAE